MELTGLIKYVEPADPKLLEWAENVKIAARWCCQECGQLDRKLLCAHHIVPKSVNPSKMYDVSNGQCLCYICHLRKHSGVPQLLILLQFATILVKRFALKDYSKAL